MDTQTFNLSPEQLEALKDALAEAEDLFIQMATTARIEAYRSRKKAELLSQELEQMEAKRISRSLNDGQGR